MAQVDPRVDAYIAQAAPFAQPILQHLRAAVSAACPDASETIKWGMPFFVRGPKILANMAAFKQHCAFGFWRGRDAAAPRKAEEAMGQFGRITALADLPRPAALKKLIQDAAKRHDSEALSPKAAPPAARPRAAVPVPEDFAQALAAVPAAAAHFKAFSPSKRHEYVEWVLEAKRPETRAKRMTLAVEQIAEGKSRHWKYQG